MSSFSEYGPSSMSWRVHADPTSLVGGIRALLLQALSIPSMVAVDTFSKYHDDPLGRFHRTTMFVAETTFGSSDDAMRAIDSVRAMHERVKGVDSETGVEFAAGDPHLLAFIHNCYTDSMLDCYSRFVTKLSDGEKDQYLEEQAQVALLLGANPDEVVTDHRLLASKIGSMDNLGVVDATLRGFSQLKNFPVPSGARFLLIPWRIAFEGATDSLPPFAKEFYRISGDPIGATLRNPVVTGLGFVLRNYLPGHPIYRSAKYRYYEGHSKKGVV
ncbi:MAG: oxygenase MpaB family protein [Actinomycetota bacterium]|nr:oxygenase MpaB family protein [Actinomycetota bacterium]